MKTFTKSSLVLAFLFTNSFLLGQITIKEPNANSVYAVGNKITIKVESEYLIRDTRALTRLVKNKKDAGHATESFLVNKKGLSELAYPIDYILQNYLEETQYQIRMSYQHNSEWVEIFSEPFTIINPNKKFLKVESQFPVNQHPFQSNYGPNVTVEVTALPDSNNIFSHWSGDINSKDNPLVITMDTDKNIKANYKPNTSALNIIAQNGTVLKKPDLVRYPPGSTVEIFALADNGYEFIGWSGDLNGPSNPFVINISSKDKNITANFKEKQKIQFQVSTLSNPSFGGTTSGGGTYNEGTTVQLTSTPFIGYTFVGWSGDASGSANPLTVTMNGNKNITANFSLNTYTLSVYATNGTVNKTPDQANYNSGAAVILTPTANPGYTFTSWSGDASGSANPLTVTMNGNKNITANFSLNTYTLSVYATNGTVNKTPDQANYNAGTTLQLTAIPSAGYTFTSWSGDASGSTNPLTVTMNGNKNITANFKSTCSPNWVVPQNQQYSLNIIGTLKIDGQKSLRNDDVIAAFINGTCSGKANVSSLGGLIFLTIASNSSNGDAISFKCFDSRTCEVINIKYAAQFFSQGDLGSIASPIEFSASTSTTDIHELDGIPTKLILDQNYPNPFNPTTRIKFFIPENGNVSLKVYNILGIEVATLVNKVLNAGSYEFEFDASQISSGVYFYRIEAVNFSQTRKMIYLR